jgi:hypothetical protein
MPDKTCVSSDADKYELSKALLEPVPAKFPSNGKEEWNGFD